MRTTAIILGIIIVVGLGVYTQKTAIFGLLDQWNLIPRTEPVTEFYVNDYTRIPTEVYPGQVIPLSFTVHNIEGIEKEYEYSVGIRPADAKSAPLRVIKHGTVTVPNAATSTITVNYSVDAAASPATIFISLTGSGHELHVQVPRRQ